MCVYLQLAQLLTDVFLLQLSNCDNRPLRNGLHMSILMFIAITRSFHSVLEEICT